MCSLIAFLCTVPVNAATYISDNNNIESVLDDSMDSENRFYTDGTESVSEGTLSPAMDRGILEEYCPAVDDPTNYPEHDEWLDEWEYQLKDSHSDFDGNEWLFPGDGCAIILESYFGDETEIDIPNRVTYDGEEYPVVLGLLGPRDGHRVYRVFGTWDDEYDGQPVKRTGYNYYPNYKEEKLKKITYRNGCLYGSTFSGFPNLEEMDLSGTELRVLQGKTASLMFQSLTALFQKCPKLKKFDFSTMKHSDIADYDDVEFRFLFRNCSSLEEVNFVGLKTQSYNCITEDTFKNCSSLKKVTIPAGFSYSMELPETFEDSNGNRYSTTPDLTDATENLVLTRVTDKNNYTSPEYMTSQTVGSYTVTYPSKITFRNSKKATVDFITVSGQNGIVIPSKIKVSKSTKTGSTTFKIKVDGIDKAEKKQLQKTKFPVEIVPYNVSDTDGITATRDKKGVIKKVTVNGIKCKKKEFSEVGNTLTFSGRFNGTVSGNW